MIVVKKKMKRSLLVAILAAVLAVLIAGAIIVNAVVNAKGGSSDGTDASAQQNANLIAARPELGEYDFGGTPYAFYPVKREQMEYVQIRTKNIDKETGDPYYYEYSFLKESSFGDAFVLSYTDKDGKTRNYIPPILAYDSATDYTGLYAVEESTGYNVPLLFWLCSGIGDIRIGERIDLSENESENASSLSAYGLASDDRPLEIAFTYLKEDKTEDSIILQVGDVLPTGSGYYFRVGSIAEDSDGKAYIKYRPCVYTTYENSSLSYAFLHFAEFINPMLIAEGLEADNAFEPYLTTAYRQWKNTFFGEGKIPVEAYSVIVDGKKYSPNDISGGLNADSDMYEFKFSALSGNSLYGALLDKSVAKYDTAPIVVTLPSYSREVDLDDEKADLYTYVIKSVDAILTSAEDNTAAGAAVASGDKIKVTYTLKINGEDVKEAILNEKGETVGYGSVIEFSGVLDLSSEFVPDGAKTDLIGKTLGSVNVSFDKEYSKTGATKRTIELVIDEIINIRSTADLNKTLDTVQVGATVFIRCYDKIDGKKSDTPYTLYVEITDEMSGKNAKIKEAIMGLTKTKKLDKTIHVYDAYLEIMQTYTAYEISEIAGYTTREETVAFKYTQNSERDPYYSESIYTNIMEDPTKRLYALEANSCETTVRTLGGLLENANHSEGFKGLKTIDVVITPDKMMKYGLYANTIYFELPRNIFPATENDEDYTSLYTLAFTLYVSDANPVTKTRYIASDMYDIIAEVDAKTFEFLDESLFSLFVRQNLVLTSVDEIKNFDIEFFTDEIHGTFHNTTEEQFLYAYGDKIYPTLATLQKEHGKDAEYTKLSYLRIQSGYEPCDCTDCNRLVSLLEKTLAETGKDKMYLDKLYDDRTTESGSDLLGSDSFKEFMGALFYTIYEDELSEENVGSVKKENLLMRMKVDMGEDYLDGSGRYCAYVYEFYRVSDRRIAVQLYKVDSSGKVLKALDNDGNVLKDVYGNDVEEKTMDYYISSFAFKKLVSKYWEIVNAIPVDKENAFTDYEMFG